MSTRQGHGGENDERAGSVQGLGDDEEAQIRERTALGRDVQDEERFAARRCSTASASSASTCSVVSHEMQASVMLWP